ncbi:tRNA (N6-threonylcarbamoyladenosine(37)-N6)-methyltransferase TrmO [Pseudodesulfovibrio tunisiensis]|uniref:tRNA (N6-threonylcarbamoyladenosine(37)-N6)-methyltransferase TrmO n=1 Tax=Pseudodesulfovibrio tunisiensis TaxID=463192 RepID=UPI001FB49D0E|nr:tRNA (N6-threonylcarbamoyladenosine(37)-N6)-methyltransferase TrmO [Pseudodesulfovibrio tunisiensis]
MDLTLTPIGHIRSSIKTLDSAPKMEDEPGAVRAIVEITPEFASSLNGLKPGMALELFTWFHLSDRSVTHVHPRGDKSRPKRGVFSTRSPQRPNPIGLHRVTLVSIEGARLEVEPLEALDNTPVIDIKPVPQTDPDQR